MYTPAMENYVINSEDIGFRLNKWNLKEKRILLVTGHSGSGKTTIARQLAQKHNAIMVEFDWFDNFADFPRKPGDPGYQDWKLYTDCIVECNGGNPLRTIRLTHVNRLALMKKSWDLFKEKVKQTGRLCVCEGLQVVSLMNVTKDPFVYPCIIKGTSAVCSAIRRKKRDGQIWMDGKKYSLLEIIVLWMGDDKKYMTFMSHQLATGQPQSPDILFR